MGSYNFSSLSSYDFEELTRDLLQAEWRTRLEAFRPGADSGIDLRGFTRPKGHVIVQCKHFAQSGYRKLLAQMRAELPTIRKLAPARYVLVTTVPLSPKNKAQLAKLLSPYVKRHSDIFGKNDVENLLKRHPKVEVANFKLWLSSTAVLQRVLHNAERCQTEFEVERVRRRLPIFVQNKAFPRAQQILNRTRIVVITGVPGIGKTTLAELLLYAHLERGYEPVVIQGGVEEGRKAFDASSKQIFYFDDFLGQTFLRDQPDMLSKNQDAALISFMEAIRHSNNARFILTTREHILKKAIDVSERIAKSSILNHKCVIELGDYSFAQKARILYNHLYFSDLPVAYKRAILKDDFFLKIVRHRNYSPRVIEWLSGYVRVREVGSVNYRKHILKLLDSPEEIWLHAFESQISNAARNVLFCLYPHGWGKEIADLEKSWESLHRHASLKYNFATSPRDFRQALNELEGSFVTIDNNHVRYLNPSIRDFIENIFSLSRDRVLDMMVSTVTFDQIIAFRDLWEERKTEQLRLAMLPDEEIITAIKRVVPNPNIRWITEFDDRQTATYLDADLEKRVTTLFVWAEEWESESLLGIALDVLTALENERKTEVANFTRIVGLLRTIEDCPWIMSRGGEAIARKMIDAGLADLSFARRYHWKSLLEYRKTSNLLSTEDLALLHKGFSEYRRHGFRREIEGCQSKGELREARMRLLEMQRENRVSLKRAINFLDKRLDDIDEDEPEDDRDVEVPETTAEQDLANEDEVRRLFSSLLD